MSKIARVMLVDDEEDIRKIISMFLEKMDYDVVTAKDGEEAMSHFHKGRFDLVISDLTMPTMDGLELLKKIRELDKDTFFLMITGHPSIETAVNAIRQGAYDYIEKPVRLEEMKLKIERALENKGLKEQLKTSHAFAWALIISIPLWLILGIIFAKLLK